MVEEELDNIDIDGIENLVGLPRLMFTDEECRNLKGVIDSREFGRNNNRRRKSENLQAYRWPLCDKLYWRDWGKHDFFCGYIFLWARSKWIERKETFSDQMNRNHFDLILGRLGRNSCTMDNLRYLNCCKWSILIKPCISIARDFFKQIIIPSEIDIIHLLFSC